MSWIGDEPDIDFSNGSSRTKLRKSLTLRLNDVQTPQTKPKGKKKKKKFGLNSSKVDLKHEGLNGKPRKQRKRRKRAREDAKTSDALDLDRLEGKVKRSVDTTTFKATQTSERPESLRKPLGDTVGANGAPSRPIDNGKVHREDGRQPSQSNARRNQLSLQQKRPRRTEIVKGKPLAPPGSTFQNGSLLLRRYRSKSTASKLNTSDSAKVAVETQDEDEKDCESMAVEADHKETDSLGVSEGAADKRREPESQDEHEPKDNGGLGTKSEEDLQDCERGSGSLRDGIHEEDDGRMNGVLEDSKTNAEQKVGRNTPQRTTRRHRRRRKSRSSGDGFDNPISLSSDSEGESDEETYRRLLASPKGENLEDDGVELFRFPFEKDCVDAIHITSSDLRRLEETEYLNDKNVDLYIKWLSQMSPELDSVRSWVRSRCAVFSSLFFTKLVGSVSKDPDPEWSKKEGKSTRSTRKTKAARNYNDISRWTRSLDIFEKDFLVIPIVQELHWSLAVVCHPGQLPGLSPRKKNSAPNVGQACILMMDSLNYHSAQKFQRILVQWLEYEARVKRSRLGSLPIASVPIVKPSIPKQQNTWDCGVYTCEYARFLFLQGDGLVVSAEDVGRRAKRIFSSCKFSADDAKQKREDMKQLYSGLRGTYRAEVKRRVEDQRREREGNGSDTEETDKEAESQNKRKAA